MKKGVVGTDPQAATCGVRPRHHLSQQKKKEKKGGRGRKQRSTGLLIWRLFPDYSPLSLPRKRKGGERGEKRSVQMTPSVSNPVLQATKREKKKKEKEKKKEKKKSRRSSSIHPPSFPDQQCYRISSYFHFNTGGRGGKEKKKGKKEKRSDWRASEPDSPPPSPGEGGGGKEKKKRKGEDRIHPSMV